MKHTLEVAGIGVAVVVVGGILGVAIALASLSAGDGPEFPY